jgi:hypothetical protein
MACEKVHVAFGKLEISGFISVPYESRSYGVLGRQVRAQDVVMNDQAYLRQWGIAALL